MSNLVGKCPDLDIANLSNNTYNSDIKTNTERGTLMEPAALTQLDFLRDMVNTLVEVCTDADLLDLICKLLATQSPG